jgi:intracellular sulfur oxidation DsrE/DsrF family protein
MVSFFSSGQSRPYNVVFDLTSSDTAEHKTVLRWIKGITKDNPNAKLEVVFYGQSLGMVDKDKSVVSNDVKEVLGNKNVSFKVCETAMKRHNMDKSQLLPGVGTVPDGIYEIVTKEGEGWGYIKVAH